MKPSLIATVVLLSAWAATSHADEVVTSTPISTQNYTKTIAGSNVLSPGRYATNVTPYFNSAMAGKLKKSLNQVPGVQDTSANVKESTLHFTVNESSSVPVGAIQKAVGQAFHGAVILTPVLEGTMTPNPGN